jgi:hypothetical protein
VQVARKGRVSLPVRAPPASAAESFMIMKDFYCARNNNLS